MNNPDGKTCCLENFPRVNLPVRDSPARVVVEQGFGERLGGGCSRAGALLTKGNQKRGRLRGHMYAYFVLKTQTADSTFGG